MKLHGRRTPRQRADTITPSLIGGRGLKLFSREKFAGGENNYSLLNRRERIETPEEARSMARLWDYSLLNRRERIETLTMHKKHTGMGITPSLIGGRGLKRYSLVVNKHIRVNYSLLNRRERIETCFCVGRKSAGHNYSLLNRRERIETGAMNAMAAAQRRITPSLIGGRGLKRRANAKIVAKE